MELYQVILDKLPYSHPFLFVDGLNAVSEEGVSGHYTFKTDEYFYQGHFKDNPITPGVILTECMGQIGVVCLGIYLVSLEDFPDNAKQFALSNATVDYLAPVLPGETVHVHSTKEYFRFGKLKCKVKMMNAKDKVVCQGIISGMIG